MISKEFWDSEDMASCSRDAQLLAIALLNYADDSGRLMLSSSRFGCKKLRSFLFSFGETTDDEILELVRELMQVDFLRAWSSRGDIYAEISTFGQYQSINKPTPSRLPVPPWMEQGEGTEIRAEDVRPTDSEVSDSTDEDVEKYDSRNATEQLREDYQPKEKKGREEKDGRLQTYVRPSRHVKGDRCGPQIVENKRSGFS